MMRFVPYIIYLLAIACFQTLLIDLTTIGRAQILFTALAVLLVTLGRGYLPALWFAWAAGLVYDAPDLSHMGVHMLILVILSITTSYAKERLNLDSIKSLMILLTTGLIVYSVPATLIYATSGSENFFYLFLTTTLPSVAYTAAIGWLFFMARFGHLSWARIKSIF
jgi:rod shape-determining protein MreD